MVLTLVSWSVWEGVECSGMGVSLGPNAGRNTRCVRLRGLAVTHFFSLGAQGFGLRLWFRGGAVDSLSFVLPAFPPQQCCWDVVGFEV